MVIIWSILETLMQVLILWLIWLLFVYKFNKDFRKLIEKIKRVISSRETHKITQIKKLIYNYFF